MVLPAPLPGLVIQYGYLWRDQARRGLEEGIKDRPCVVVLSVGEVQGDRVVIVAPITHIAPKNSKDGVAVPAATKLRLGLDDAQSWIVSTEVNRFVWPGPDLRPVARGKAGTFAYGYIPGALLQALRKQIVAHGRIAMTNRDRPERH